MARFFLRCSAVLLGALLGCLLIGCVHARDAVPEQNLDSLLAKPETRLMWIGAHPDDETLAGPILARACLYWTRPCLIVSLTQGEGGACARPEACQDMAEVRQHELLLAATAYGAELLIFHYPNAPLPWSSFPTRAQIRAAWHPDPVAEITQVLREFKPTVVLSFGTQHGFTGHPEHQLAAEFAHAAVQDLRQESTHAAVQKPRQGLTDSPDSTVPLLYQILNHYSWTRLVGSADPEVPTESFDTQLVCDHERRSCLDVALQITRAHRSQNKDMALVRALRPQMNALYLRRVL